MKRKEKNTGFNYDTFLHQRQRPRRRERRNPLRVAPLLCVLLVALIIGGSVYAVYTLTYTDLRVENLQIYWHEGEVQMALNSTLYNADGDTRGVNDPIPLAPGVQTALINFLKPHVQAISTGYDVNPPAWAAP